MTPPRGRMGNTRIVEAASALSEICDQFGIDILYVFGSRARDAARFALENRPLPPGDSDLDVGVLPARPLSARRKVALALALEDLFGVERVDRDSWRADEYELYIFLSSGRRDLIPLERERLALIAENLRQGTFGR